jgi:hypothetical protein
MELVNAALLKAVELFNSGRFAEFQDALDSMTSTTRASSERQFYTVLKNVAEGLLQLSDGDVADAEVILRSAHRRLEEFLPRFRGLNTATLREELQHVVGELRAEGHKAPSKLPRLRVLPT